MKIQNKKSDIIFVLINLGIIIMSVLVFYTLFNRQDLMQKYDVYQKGDFVIVESKEEPEIFYFKEWIYYSDFVEDVYLCTKEGGRTGSEKEVYVYMNTQNTEQLNEGLLPPADGIQDREERQTEKPL